MIAAVFGSRFGLAGIVALALGVVVGGLLIGRANLRTELADERLQVATLTAAIHEQNARVIDMQQEAEVARLSADARVVAALKPRAKPNLQSVEELNRWFAHP